MQRYFLLYVLYVEDKFVPVPPPLYLFFLSSNSQASTAGPFFGIQESFTGMAVIVNTNRGLLSKNLKPGEPNGRHRDVTVVANNGTRGYGDLIASLEGCAANVRFDENRDDFNVLQVGG